MEALPAAPPTGEGLLITLPGRDIEFAIRKGVAGMPIGRLAQVRSALPGQPIFLFDTDARLLHGPYAASGPGGANLDPASSKLPAQVKFTPVVRSFAPLPEEVAGDLLTWQPGPGKGSRRPASKVDAAVVGPLLLLFVLRHHNLLNQK